MTATPISEEERSTLEALQDVACGVQPLQFKKIETYTTFTAEYAFDHDDIVMHFFLPKEREGDMTYWLQVFPMVLDPVARKYFQAEKPRLRASYTEEVESWWMRADGYKDLIDRAAYVERFFEKLDQALDTKSST